MKEFLAWLRQKWLELINRARPSFVVRVSRKSVEMNDNDGEARLWGDKETVQEIARFYDKFKTALVTVVEIRRLTGKNTATGFLDDMRRCFIELENDRAKEDERRKKEVFEAEQKKRKEIFKKIS